MPWTSSSRWGGCRALFFLEAFTLARALSRKKLSARSSSYPNFQSFADGALDSLEDAKGGEPRGDEPASSNDLDAARSTTFTNVVRTMSQRRPSTQRVRSSFRRIRVGAELRR